MKCASSWAPDLLQTLVRMVGVQQNTCPSDFVIREQASNLSVEPPQIHSDA